MSSNGLGDDAEYRFLSARAEGELVQVRATVERAIGRLRDAYAQNPHSENHRLDVLASFYRSFSEVQASSLAIALTVAFDRIIVLEEEREGQAPRTPL